MSDISKRLDDCLSAYLRPLTYPIGIKFIKKGGPVPEKAKVPTKAFGHPITMCQATNLARRFGWTVAMFKDDNCCPVAQVVLGYVEEPDFIKDGSIVKPLYADTDEAAIKTQQFTPKMPHADTYCIVAAPLNRASFDPDVALIYGNAAQITRLVQAALYKIGGYVESRFAGRAACGGEIVVPYAQNIWNVIIPGGGERVFAMTSDDELAFAIPASQIENVMIGLETTHKSGIARIPTPGMGTMVVPKFPKTYHDLEVYCGLAEK